MEAYLVRQDPFTSTSIPLAETTTEGLTTRGSIQVILDETFDERVIKNTK